MVGDLKALMRFVGNFAGRNSIGRPLRARIECIVVYKNWRDPRGVVGTSFGVILKPCSVGRPGHFVASSYFRL